VTEEPLRRRLESAATLPAVLEVMADAKSAKDRRGDRHGAAVAGGLWIEGMVKADHMLAAMREAGELASVGRPTQTSRVATFFDHRISRQEAFRWHQLATVDREVREAYVRDCFLSGRRVGVQGLLRFARHRDQAVGTRDEARRRLRTSVVSALRGLDHLLRLAPEQATELPGCRDRLMRQLDANALLDVIDDAERPGTDLGTPFAALLSGSLVGGRDAPSVVPVKVLAVLERTAVVCPPGCELPSGSERKLARISELFVDGAAIRWKTAGQELRFGFDGKVAPHARRRCPRCNRREGEVEFRAYRTSYCIRCAREVAREQRRRPANGREGDEAA
jgi:hypothetical protein